jgi:CHAD domain-containing protein
MLDPSWVSTTRGELRWVAGALGEVRDRDVLMDKLRRRVAELPVEDGPAALGLLAKLDAELGQARDALLGVLRSARYLSLIDTLVQGANDPPLTEQARLPAGAVLPRLARKPWKRLAQAVSDLPPQPGDVELHHVRVLAKRARYAAEAVAPVAGRGAARFADAVAGLQGVLGDLHDAVVAQQWLRTAAGRHPTRALVAGELLAQEAADAASLRGCWRAVWEKAARKKLRSWMR